MRVSKLFLVGNMVMLSMDHVASFQSFQLPKFPFFDKPMKQNSFPLEEKKAELLKAVSFTNNGKDATVQQQKKVLKLVGEIESAFPPPETIFSNLEEGKELLDGVWYLQYTSPSEIMDEEDEDEDANDIRLWEVENAEEQITTKKTNSKGSVTAQGIQVDTDKGRPVKQIFDFEKGIVTNEVEADFGFVTVGGPFRASDKKYNRAIVGFVQGEIQFKFGYTLKLNWIFDIGAKVRGTNDNGWLETTYVGPDMRLGRGNKGTMFVLTRDPDAVQP